MVGMHPQSLADFTGKGQAALSREVFTASFKSYLAKLSTVTFIGLMDTDEVRVKMSHELRVVIV